ncbi:MAG: site-2 protease family protein [Patescibacteria group bacterium]
MSLLLILGIILFIGLVIVHELGHFLVARRYGVEVEEFGLGFPPKAKSLGFKNGTEYTLNWLPLGGFVRLKGEHDSAKGKGAYGSASLPNKMKIMVAGVAMNLLTAFFILTALSWIGTPQLVENQFNVQGDSRVVRRDVLVAYVEPDSPAEIAGLKIRDQLTSIGTVEQGQSTIQSQEQLPDITKKYAGKTVIVQFRRQGIKELQKTELTLLSQGEIDTSNSQKGYLGIAPNEYVLKRSTWSAPINAIGTIGQFTSLTLKGLGKALSSLVSGNASQASEQVAGPVGIFVLISDGTGLGIEFILMIIAIISLTLAIMNVLPIPALDGGRLFVTLIFRVIKKPLKVGVEDRIHGTGFAILMLLFVVITFVDIRRFW